MGTSELKIIVITPVRNEAWVLDAFLTCTSSWADYIILADHHSEDNTREIAKKYEKVILIDNPTFEWYEAQCLTRLLEEACKIHGDKVNTLLTLMSALSGHVTYSDLIKNQNRLYKGNRNVFFDVEDFAKSVLKHMKDNGFL